MTAIRSSAFSQWNTAFEKKRSTGEAGSGVYVDRSAMWKSWSGRTFFARFIMSGDESSPVIVADGYWFASTVVELPGPQPRSIILFGAVRGTCDRRSRAGWVRSFSNLRYWFALQSLVCWDIVVVKCL